MKQKEHAKRKRQEGKGATGGKLPKRQKGAKKEWWEEGDAGASDVDDEAAYYEQEVRCLPAQSVALLISGPVHESLTHSH